MYVTEKVEAKADLLNGVHSEYDVPQFFEHPAYSEWTPFSKSALASTFSVTYILASRWVSY
jgi:hypothetical protein